MKRIAMATPYPLDVNEIEKRFLEGNGFEVVSCDGLDLVDWTFPSLMDTQISPSKTDLGVSNANQTTTVHAGI
jgi:maleate cis-trans isomerase